MNVVKYYDGRKFKDQKGVERESSSLNYFVQLSFLIQF